MPELLTLLESNVESEASILKEILIWNGIDAQIVLEPATGSFQIKIQPDKEEAAKSVLEMTANKKPSNSHHFVFVSHTSADVPFIQANLVPILREHYIDFVLINYMKGAEVYRQWILRALENCGWFLVVFTKQATDSKWVKFELAWAMRHRDREHIILVLAGDCDPRTLDTRLSSFDLVDFRIPSPGAKHELSSRLPKIDLADKLA